MRITRFAMIAAVLVAGIAPCAAQSIPKDQYSIGAPSDWIDRGTPDIAPSDLRSAPDGVEDLWLDRQTRVDSQGAEHYFRYAQHVVSERGVDGASRITIYFDPHSDRIELHNITVTRGADRLDQLKTAEINVLRREDRLEDGLIDGDLTLSIVLEDIRVGDVVEYSFTRRYVDPAVRSRFSDWFTTQWSTPTRWSRLRLLHPIDRKISIKQAQSVPPPREVRSGAWRELTWEWHDLAGRPDESERPSWHRHYPRIEMSEWQSWSEVVDWALGLYRPGSTTPEMRALVQEWERDAATTAERIVLALRFVQDQVRYTGIEVGEGAYSPTDPARVLQRRFGDCKDKVMLLVTLLRAMNVDAQAALVDTGLQHGLLERLPARDVFDHAIVRVRHDGREYWFDATASLQGGTLDTIAQAHLGAALVIEKGVRELQIIPPPNNEAIATEVLEAFDMTEGYRKKASLHVTTVYTGAAADDQRHSLQGTTLEEIGRNYLNYYRDWYPTIAQTSVPETKDDRVANRIEVTERYAFEPAFREQDDGQIKFDINPDMVSSRLRAPKLVHRTTPLAVDHPQHVRYVATVQFPSAWSTKNEDVLIEDPAFVYRSNLKRNGRRFEISYEYRSLSDHVEAERAAEYARNVERADDDTGYWFKRDPKQKSSSLDTLNLAGALACLLGLLSGVLLVRAVRARGHEERVAPEGSPVGIRGWLVLPAIHTCLMPFTVLVLLYQQWPYMSIDEWKEIGSGQSDLVSQLLKLGIFSSMFSICLVGVAGAYAVAALFRHRRSFPAIYVYIAVVLVLHDIIALAMTFADPESNTPVEIATFGADILSLILWIAYMRKSKRVAATFTAESYSSRRLPLPGAPASLSTS